MSGREGRVAAPAAGPCRSRARSPIQPPESSRPAPLYTAALDGATRPSDARRWETAARIVDLAQSFHDERHQRGRLVPGGGQREDVADVRRIEAGPLSVNGSPYMSPTDVSTPPFVPSTCADGPWPDGPLIGSATLRGVLHHRDEAVGRIDAAIAVRGVATATRPPSSYAPAAPPQATRSTAVLAEMLVKRVEVAEIGRVFRRKDRARDDDAIVQSGVIESKRSRRRTPGRNREI